MEGLKLLWETYSYEYDIEPDTFGDVADNWNLEGKLFAPNWMEIKVVRVDGDWSAHAEVTGPLRRRDGQLGKSEGKWRGTLKPAEHHDWIGHAMQEHLKRHAE